MEEFIPTTIVEAIDFTHDALGVCKLEDGYTVFVEDMLKGEKAEILVTERKKNYGFGKVIERIERSPYRVAPKCKHFYECGGCSLMHMDYDLQVNFKKYRLEAQLRRLATDDFVLRDTIAMMNPYYYRNKVEIKFSQGEKGIEAGFFQAKSHRLVNIEECYIMPKKTFETLTLIKNICNELKIRAYDELSKTGLLKSAVIRESFSKKEIVILLQTSNNEFTSQEEFIAKLLKKIPEIKGIGRSVAIDESMLSLDNIELIYGRNFLNDVVNGISYEIGFRSFFQTNTLQTEKLYNKALEYAGLTGKDKVIDAYCGIGSIGLGAAKDSYKVYGIEVVKQAILDARKNAEKNDIQNAFFEVGTAETVIKKWKKYNFDVIFIDPPRKGCAKEFIDAVIGMKIPKIVYVSCDPATLARDITIFKAGGYILKEVTPVDMFPQTTHVESVSLLQLKK
ncbi:MAG: 23S rRNA (uracil(1939)-C(5))-methyltransferase RlmD [Candidatus Izemoplasmatales bacterium]|jgi:23S rRNA (uracil1939-C5)-methyltransferase|nr:23S rRNA (uracil(1939)-C(5))-methyltransferase RlmD [Candidatus Izemoplasmatales bacterium]